MGRRVLRLRITETEAYFGEDDTACHASRGRTPRTAVMYGDGGHAYIYLCYGMHEMFNIVSGCGGVPEAVLVRGVEGFAGPGRLTRALAISRVLNGIDLTRSRELWLEDDGTSGAFTAAPRIGIGYASPRDRARRWRFTTR
jgi:DNA-3-methyladenine glycosylase